MNKFVISVKMQNESEPTLFLVTTEETRNYVTEAIKEAQIDYQFESSYDLMEYVCSTYDFKLDAFYPDISIVEK